MFVKRISHIRRSTGTLTQMHRNESGSCSRIQILLAGCLLARPNRRISHIWTDNQLHQSIVHTHSVYWCERERALNLRLVYIFFHRIVCIARSKSWAWKCFNITNWFELFHFILSHSNYPSIHHISRSLSLSSCLVCRQSHNNLFKLSPVWTVYALFRKVVKSSRFRPSSTTPSFVYIYVYGAHNLQFI